MTVKQKEAAKARREKEEEAKKNLETNVPEVPEAQDKVPEKPGKTITCNRCGLKYKDGEAVIREEEKCCPECEAPQKWLR